MTSINSFLISYASFVFLSTSILSLINVNLIGAYLTVYAVGFYVATEIASPLDLSASRRKAVLAIMFAAIFIAIVLQTTLAIIQTASG